MELKREFANMVDRMGLEDSELSLAEIVWQKAERAMQGKQTQEAVLLTPAVTFVRQPQSLTREEIQFLTGFNRELLDTSQHNMRLLKKDIQSIWDLCDPDDAATTENFEILNDLRTHQRKVSGMMRKLEKIQHKLKKQR